MKNVIWLSLVSLLILSITVAHASAQTSKTPVIILFVPNASQHDMREVMASVNGEITHEFTIINGLAASVPPTRIQELKNHPLVVSVDKDAAVNAVDLTADQQISANQVWPLGFTGTGVRLAILDTGIATQHPEFAGRIVACHTEVKMTTTCEDDNGHGTHVAGIAGAQGVDPSAKGVAPSVSLMSDKVLNSAGSGSLSGVVAGIDWAVTNHARIISMSLGTSPVDGGGTQPNCDSVFPTLTHAINNAVAAGVAVVAAAGNSGTAGLGAPGCISSVIAAGAVDSSDQLASFSSVGAAMKDHGIAAPGVDIYSSFLNGGYAVLSGTSMATPMVSGTIALMLSKNPNQSPTTMRSVLFSTADCVQTPCPNTDIGHGRVNALSAVNAVPAKVAFAFTVDLSPAAPSV
jgi:subtilisin family serine protease